MKKAATETTSSASQVARSKRGGGGTSGILTYSAVPELHAQTVDETSDAFGDGLALQRTVRDTKVAAVGHAERRPGDDGDAVLADQPLAERHRIQPRMDVQQTIERAVGRRHVRERRARRQLVHDKTANFWEIA